jgi:hypothetical protein
VETSAFLFLQIGAPFHVLNIFGAEEYPRLSLGSDIGFLKKLKNLICNDGLKDGLRIEERC